MQTAITFKTQLLDTITQVQDYFKNLKGSQLGELTVIYEGMLATQLETIGRVRQRLAGILSDLRQVKTVRISSKEYS